MLARALGLLALAASASAAGAQDAAPAEPPKEKKICRAVTPTGSVMAKRICLTKAEWKQFNANYDRQGAALRDGQGRHTPN
jgi:hypothetical protein